MQQYTWAYFRRQRKQQRDEVIAWMLFAILMGMIIYSPIFF